MCGPCSRHRFRLRDWNIAWSIVWQALGVWDVRGLRLLAEWQGEYVALEAKALIPSAALWAKKEQKGAEIQYEEVLARAVRRPDP